MQFKNWLQQALAVSCPNSPSYIRELPDKFWGTLLGDLDRSEGTVPAPRSQGAETEFFMQYLELLHEQLTTVGNLPLTPQVERLLAQNSSWKDRVSTFQRNQQLLWRNRVFFRTLEGSSRFCFFSRAARGCGLRFVWRYKCVCSSGEGRSGGF